ncbi:MAG: DNA topoisomerase IV subunit A [bacterium]
MAKKKDKIDILIEERILDEKLEDIIGERFGRYSKYIIQERAIPDVRDGLKPVQRRILYCMDLMNLSNKKVKSAQVVGEVMGKYHPHGDSSIYEAAVRMSQIWKMGETLVTMQGNNGSIDGDSAAAMRYTEIKLSAASGFMLKDLHQKIVPYAPTYDDSRTEPTVLPAKYPNILVNGSTGISSGYATNIPTHNISEVINATIALIDKPNLSMDSLLEIMHGPDFPTGGIVQGIDGIRQAFTTGRGKVIIRSKVDIVDIAKDQKQIVITEIPYEVNKATLVGRIEQMRIDKTIEDIVEVRDETSDDIRICIDLKKGANYSTILTYLFKNTDLQISYNYNMVAICNHRPVCMGVIEILKAYITHQKDVITNRSNYELEKTLKRLHIIEGLMKLLDVTDEVIRIIRGSKNKADSKVNIIAAFGFSELQAEAIVMLNLYKLSSQDINALIEENNELNEYVEKLNLILSNEKELLKVIKNELREVNKALGHERRSEIMHEVEKLEINAEDLISKEDVAVNLSKDGYIKRSNMKSYSASQVCGLKDGDCTIFSRIVSTLDTLLVFTSLGNYMYIPVHKIEDTKWKDIGKHINSIVLLEPKERIIDVIVVNDFNKGGNILLCTKFGLIKQTSLKEFEVQRYSKTVRGMKVSPEDELVSVCYTHKPLEVAVVTHNAELLRFRASDIAMYGTQASGIKSINLKPGDFITSAVYTNVNNDILLLTKRGYVKRMKMDEFSLSKRSKAGSHAIKFIKANPHYIVGAKVLTPNQYKDAVKVNICYSKGNDYLPATEFKYNVSDVGKNILNKELGECINMFIDHSIEEEVNADYLHEDIQPVKKVKPLPSSNSVLSDLDAILAREGGSFSAVDNAENEKTSIPKFAKVSLFDDED